MPPDFGEYPSQFNEMWAREPAVLAHFARHDKTGEPMPKYRGLTLPNQLKQGARR